jgi:hypothetical protein
VVNNKVIYNNIFTGDNIYSVWIFNDKINKFDNSKNIIDDI